MTQVEATSPNLHGCAATAVSVRPDEAVADSAVCSWRCGGCGSAVRFVGAFSRKCNRRCQAHCRLVSVRSRTLDIAPSAARICVRAAHDAACAARPGVGARVARLQLLTASASVVHGRSDRPARRSRELLGACRRGEGGVRGCHRAPVGSAVADWVVRAMVRALTGPAAGACGTARSTRERVELGGACRLAGVLT